MDDDHEIIDDNKRAVQNEIFDKMQRMNDMFIDLSEDEIDQIEEILEPEHDEEDYDDVRSEDDDVRSEDDFEWLSNPNTEPLPKPFTSKVEFEDNKKASIDESNQSTVNDNSYVNNVNSNHSTINDNANVPLNLVEVKNEEVNTSNQNNSATMPLFSPPSTSSSSAFTKIPDHFVRLDPSLHQLLTKQAKAKAKDSNASKLQMTLDKTLEIVELIFPGKCTYVS